MKNQTKRVMKLTFITLFLSTTGMFASVNSQNTRVNIHVNNANTQIVLNEIEKQTDYLFVYDTKEIDLNRKVSVEAQNKTVADVLSSVFTQTDISYAMEGNNIMLMRKNTSVTQQSNRRITGVVKDAIGEPIIGANIVEKGTTNGIITDINGNFSLMVSENAILQISYIGYQTQEIPTKGQTNIQITMKDDAQALDDVVVIGYGTQRKKDVAGSISSISTKDLSIQSSGNIQNLLQGRLSGVSVTTSGVAGDAPAIRIRGVGTLNNNSPLYVIDGFPTKSEIASQINPSSIESVQVLKDASSASIYGSQAANGVILITTKQGKEGKPTVDVKVNVGVQLPTNLPEMLNSQQYGEVLWNAMRNAGLTPQHDQYGNGATPVIPDYILPAGAMEGQVDLSTYNTAENQFMRANKIGTNWADEVYRPAPTTNIDISAQGGGNGSKYFLSANYYKQEALVKWAGYDRFSLRANSQFKILSFATLGSNLSATYSKYKGSKSDHEAVRMAPLIPVYDVEGNWAGTKANGLGDSKNPVAQLYNQRENYNDNLNLLGNLYLDINFLKYFQFKTNVGVNVEDSGSKEFNPKTYWNKGDANTLVNSLKEARGRKSELVWNNTLTFTKKFRETHNLNVLLGTEAISSKIENLSAYRSNFIIEDPDYRYLDAGESNKDNTGNANEYALFSLFARVNYQYKDKYYLGAIIRRDGSSRFGANHRYGYFPGVNAAWRLTEENFMKGQDILSDLKIRASYGLTGNQDIDNYAFASMYYTNISTSSYPIAGDPNSVTQGISKESIGNPDLKWETTTQTNIGIDAGLFNNKLNLSFDFYHKYTTDILQRITYPSTGGVASAPFMNIGEMQNNGYELNINFQNTTDYGFRYELGLILSGYRNEVKKLASSQFISNTYTRTEVGHPISSFYGYVIDGIFQTQGEVDSHVEQSDKAIGRWKYRDVNNDGKIDSQDRAYIGNPHPDFEYSLSSRFYYKNFDLSLYIQGSQGNDICFASKGGRDGLDFWGDYFNKSTRILNTWTPENRNAELPEINILNPNDEAGKVSSYLIEDGSYIRLKQLELGYTLPKQTLSKIGLQQCRVYLNAENLLTLTKYNNIDPEVKNGDDKNMGVDYMNNMPLARVFSIGFNLSF